MNSPSLSRRNTVTEQEIASKLGPKLTGPRIEADTPHIRIELVCVCGRALEAATYIDHSNLENIVKMVVVPCPCYQKVKR